MVDFVFWADAPGGSNESSLPRGGVGNQGGIEVMDGQDCVEGALGHRAFRTCSRCRGGFTRETRYAVHKELGQFQIVNRCKTRKRPNPVRGISCIIAPPREYGSHGVQNLLVHGKATPHTGSQSSKIYGTRIEQIGTSLEVTRVFGWLSVYETRVCRGDKVIRAFLAFGGLANKGLHGFGVFFEVEGLFHLGHPFLSGKGLKIAYKVSGQGKLDFRLLVETT